MLNITSQQSLQSTLETHFTHSPTCLPKCFLVENYVPESVLGAGTTEMDMFLTLKGITVGAGGGGEKKGNYVNAMQCDVIGR